MRTGLMLFTAAAATLGTAAISTPASAQYYHDNGYHRGWNHDDRGDWRRHEHWRHEREREREWRWRHARHVHGYNGYYGRDYYRR